jgi:hypothetical protein
MSGDETTAPVRLASVAALTDASTLSMLLNRPVERVVTSPMQHVGFSDAVLSRVTLHCSGGGEVQLVLKQVPADEWTSRRTGDSPAREARVLGEPALAGIWDVFECPYLAFADDEHESGLLMRDLGDRLLPDERAAMRDDQELALLTGLARLHATFWNRVPAAGWLARPSNYCEMMAPSIVSDPGELARLPPPLQTAVGRGWAVALARLPERSAHLLTGPGRAWEQAWSSLPQTFLHGDAKVANFAFGPGPQVAAFDWSCAGSGPCSIDLGWYLAVNASRLASPKETIIARYRRLLEAATGAPIAGDVWQRLENAAIVAGARMLLWNKAFAIEIGKPGAEAEWRWWVDRLTILT